MPSAETLLDDVLDTLWKNAALKLEVVKLRGKTSDPFGAFEDLFKGFGKGFK